MIIRSLCIFLLAASVATAGKSRVERPRRILCFTASWCGACQRLKREEFPRLEEKKWHIGPEAKNHVQQIDVDKNPELAERYKIESLPTLVLVENGKETARHGYLSADQIAWLWLGKAPNVTDRASP